MPAPLLLVLLCLWVHAPAFAQADGLPPGDELVLGRVSDNPRDDYGRLKPLLDYVVPRMADVGIRRGRVLMARDNQQMVSYLKRGRVDWVTETAGSAVAYQERGGARLLLATARGGVESYHSVFFVRADSRLDTLGALRGRSIAFQSRASTSAYFLPAATLLDAGLPLAILASPADRPGPDHVGFVYARSEFNIAAWVHKGLVDAGAFGEQDWRALVERAPAMASDLVVIARTAQVPRALELVRDGISPAVEQRLAEVLQAAPSDPAARPALQAYWNSTGFRRLDPAMVEALAQLRAGVARIRAEVE